MPSEQPGEEVCRYCSAEYRPHPGFVDHPDICDLNPINRPHIAGTANAPGIDLSIEPLRPEGPDD